VTRPAPGPSRPALGRRRFAAVIALIGTAGLAVAGCGSSPPTAGRTSTTTTAAPAGTAPGTAPAGAGTPLTAAQALTLAQLLYRDYQLGGARVAVDVPYATGVQVLVTGDVDFKHHEGHLRVVTSANGTSEVQRVDYTASVVYEQGGPIVAKALQGHPGRTWVSRPPDPTGRPIDKIIAVLVALASPQRDNPLLVGQSDVRFEGRQGRGRTAVDVYRYSAAITYLVGASDGLLHQFRATIQGFAGTVSVSLSGWGPRTLPPPPEGSVLDDPDA
jgi:hypothetical protein